MKRVSLEYEVEITDEEQEVDVELVFRCFFAPKMALYPMAVSASVYKGKTLGQLKQDCTNDYLKDYQKVELVKVLVDTDALKANKY